MKPVECPQHVYAPAHGAGSQWPHQYQCRFCTASAPATGLPSQQELWLQNQRLQADLALLRGQLDQPVTESFMAGVPAEALHQQWRWGAAHDAGKTPYDWFWLVGFLAQKAAAAAVAGDLDKAKHHTISTAAALANWHAALSAGNTWMRPGIDPANIPAEQPAGPRAAPTEGRVSVMGPGGTYWGLRLPCGKVVGLHAWMHGDETPVPEDHVIVEPPA